jgi:hypothetical protein
MSRFLIVASIFALFVPAALAVPPSDNGKPDHPGASASAPGQSAEQNAAKACKAERAKDPVAFSNQYGTNANKRNAFGKCVSSKVKAAAQGPQDQAEQNAAKACKAELAKDPVAFANKYGTNANKRNAFGKCVSSKVKSSSHGNSNKGAEQDDDSNTGD